MRHPASDQQRPRRYVAIDGLRFVAAMGVVAHHYAGLAGAPWAESRFAKYYLFVDFFFAISGFVIFHNYGSRLSNLSAYGDFLRNRIARVYPLHLLTFLGYAALALTIWRDKTDRSFVDAAAIAPNLLLAHAWGTTGGTSFNYPSWSISAEWLAYLAFPLVVWLIARGGAKGALVAAGLIVAGLEFAAHAGLIEPWTTLTFHFGALRALPTFLIGAALAHGIEAAPLRLPTHAPPRRPPRTSSCSTMARSISRSRKAAPSTSTASTRCRPAGASPRAPWRFIHATRTCSISWTGARPLSPAEPRWIRRRSARVRSGLPRSQAGPSATSKRGTSSSSRRASPTSSRR